MILTIIMIISLILDGLLTNYLPFMINDLSLFTPLLTLVTIFIIYPYFRKKEKKYFIMLLIIGLLYDLLYTNLIFFNAIMFLGIGYISKIIYKNYEINYFNLILYTVLLVVIYESVTALIFFIFNLVPITIPKVVYKITHSLLLNIIYAEIIYIILKLIPKKYLKISIN